MKFPCYGFGKHGAQMSRYDRRVRRTLQGMAVGDAFGMALLRSVDTAELIARRQCPTRPWLYTCATVQTAVVARHIHASGTIRPEHLATELADAYAADPDRHYGSNTRALLRRVQHGECWRTLSLDSFAGFGSMGVGAALRAVPVGHHYAHDLPRALDTARQSAMVTHANTNAVEGAAAVALVASLLAAGQTDVQAIWDALLSELKPSFTRKRIFRASGLPGQTTPEQAAEQLGNGRWKCAHDTVPYAIWCALNHHHDYRAAMWCAADGAGRLHTTCALVSALLCAGQHTPPAQWLERTERLPGRLTRLGRVDTPVSPYRRTQASQ